MFRILKPVGTHFMSIIPFLVLMEDIVFFCTLDFMWGHVRLSTKDFQKYIKQFRPFEYDLAIRFYNENLNRMTSTQLKQYIKIAGFEHRLCFP